MEGKMGPCKIPQCREYHLHLLHDAANNGLLLHADSNKATSGTVGINLESNTLLLVQEISVKYGFVLSFFDNGSTISLISGRFTRRNMLKGIKVLYDLITVGGNTEHLSS